MEKEKIDVDLEEYQRQYRENAEKDGIVFKIWLEKIDEEDFVNNAKPSGTFCTPSVYVKGNASPIMIAALINSCEAAFDRLRKKDPLVQPLEEMLKLLTRPGEILDVKGENND